MTSDNTQATPNTQSAREAAAQPQTFASAAALQARVGQEVAVSHWLSISQAQVQQFADATLDQQWIHTDPARAAAGPFGAPIAHGFLTLSLLPHFLESCIHIGNSAMTVNYGLNKVRFMAPVPVGSRLRARLTVATLELLPPDAAAGIVAGSCQITWRVTLEREGQAKPVCVAEMLGRRYAKNPE